MWTIINSDLKYSHKANFLKACITVVSLLMIIFCWVTVLSASYFNATTSKKISWKSGTTNYSYLRGRDLIYIYHKVTSRLTNFTIYDTKQRTKKLYFSTAVHAINSVIWPSYYNKNNQQIIFGDNFTTARYLSNNYAITQPQLDYVVVETENSEGDKRTLWTSKKNGANLRVLFAFTQEWSWHLDVKNSTIRFFKSEGEQVIIKEYPL